MSLTIIFAPIGAHEVFFGQHDGSGFSDGEERTKNLGWMYYRKPDGWIVAAPGDAVSRKHNEFCGWEPLEQYGQYTMRMLSGSDFAKPDLFFQLFKNGGAHEFIKEQVIEHGWHRNPPDGVTFWQVDNKDFANDVQCPFCFHIFAQQAHLDKHVGITHKDEMLTNPTVELNNVPERWSNQTEETYTYTEVTV